MTNVRPANQSVMEQKSTQLSQVRIGEQLFQVEVADNDVRRQMGLMWRESLSENGGMLFVFQQEFKHSFWMKNTLIPLDLIWISADMQVVDFQTAEPCPANVSDCPSFAPKEKALFVLEVDAGAFLGKVGDFVEIR